MFTGLTIPRAIVDCIGQGRAPRVQEICAVADHIRSDVTGRPRGGALLDIPTQLRSLRAAQAALAGCA